VVRSMHFYLSLPQVISGWSSTGNWPETGIWEITTRYVGRYLRMLSVHLTYNAQSGHWITCAKTIAGARQRNALILRRALDALPLCQNHMVLKGGGSLVLSPVGV
jgi:hypothetical protein